MVVAAVSFLAAPVPVRAGTVSAVSLAATVDRSERILVVEVLEPVDSATPCELTYGFRYKVERALRGATAAGTEDLYTDGYPQGDVTSEECPESRSFEAYFGDVRPPFERGQRLILFLGDRVPHHAFESTEWLAEVGALAGTPPQATPPPPAATTIPAAPPPTSAVPPRAPPPSPPPAVEPPPFVAPAGPATGPTVLESEGRAVLPGVTELVFISDDDGVAVIGGASSLAAGSAEEGGPPALGGTVACRTPCRLRVPNGSYLFHVGSTEFMVAATGGEQTWNLVEENSAALAAGEHLTYDGIGTLAGAGVLLAITLGGEGASDTSVQAIVAYTLLGLGFTSMAIGIPLWALCGGSAEQVSGDAGAGVTGLSLLPGPVAVDPGSGRTAWGLSLALTF